MRTQSPGAERRHRRVDAVCPRLVRRRGNNAPFAGPADDHRLPLQCRITPHLDATKNASMSTCRIVRAITLTGASRSWSSGPVRRRRTRSRAVAPTVPPKFEQAAHEPTANRPTDELRVVRATKRASTTMPSGSATVSSPSNAIARCASTRNLHPIRARRSAPRTRVPPTLSRRVRSPLRPRVRAPRQLLALLDHSAGCAPVVAAVAAPVLHQQQAVGALDEGTADEPIADGASLAPAMMRRCTPTPNG